MQEYIFRRLLLIAPTILVVSLAIFTILRLLPGDVALNILTGGGDVKVDPQAYAQLRHDLGLDRPLHEQYLSWLWSFVRLEGGRSLWSGQPVVSEISLAVPVTLELTVLSTGIALLLGAFSGIISAIRQDTPWDYALRAFAISGLSMPTFCTGALLLLFLVIFFQWSPPLEFASLLDNPVKNLQQMVWPALILGYAQAALLSRITRSAMLDILRQDYLRTAWSKGLLARHVIIRHGFRNALLPIVTLSGIQFGHLLGGAVIVESLFALPGVGSRLVDAVLQRDWTMVQTLVTLFALVFLLINLAVDLLYGWLDPRIRYVSRRNTNL